MNILPTARSHLIKLLVECGIPKGRVITPDREYVFTTKNWIIKTFKPWLAKALGPKLLVWQAERYDCDNLALSALARAQELHAATPGAPAAALAAGELWYRTPRGGHAIFVALTCSPGKSNFELIGLDRARWKSNTILKVVRLTRAELKTTSFCRFG